MGNIFSCCVNRQKNIEYVPKPRILRKEEKEDYFFFNETDDEYDTIYDYGSIDL